MSSEMSQTWSLFEWCLRTILMTNASDVCLWSQRIESFKDLESTSGSTNRLSPKHFQNADQWVIGLDWRHRTTGLWVIWLLGDPLSHNIVVYFKFSRNGFSSAKNGHKWMIGFDVIMICGHNLEDYSKPLATYDRNSKYDSLSWPQNPMCLP